MTTSHARSASILPPTCARTRPRPAKTVRHDSHRNRNRNHRSDPPRLPQAREPSFETRDARRTTRSFVRETRASPSDRASSSSHDSMTRPFPSHFDRIATRRLARARDSLACPNLARSRASRTRSHFSPPRRATRPFSRLPARGRARVPSRLSTRSRRRPRARRTPRARAPWMRSIERWMTNVVVDWGFRNAPASSPSRLG